MKLGVDFGQTHRNTRLGKRDRLRNFSSKHLIYRIAEAAFYQVKGRVNPPRVVAFALWPKSDLDIGYQCAKQATVLRAASRLPVVGGSDQRYFASVLRPEFGESLPEPVIPPFQP